MDDVFENDVSDDNEDERLPVNPKKKSVRPSPIRKACPTTRLDSIIDGPRQLGWEFRFQIPIPGTAGIRNSDSEFGIPELSGGNSNRKT